MKKDRSGRVDVDELLEPYERTLIELIERARREVEAEKRRGVKDG